MLAITDDGDKLRKMPDNRWYLLNTVQCHVARSSIIKDGSESGCDAIASETSNLSFFSTRAPAITESQVVTQNALEPITYDPTRTYVAFVVGDGDNIGYMMSTRRDWFLQRSAACQAAAPATFGTPSTTGTASR